MPSQQHAVRPRDREAGGRRSMLHLEPAAEAAVTRAGVPLSPAGAALDIWPSLLHLDPTTPSIAFRCAHRRRSAPSAASRFGLVV